MKLARSSDADHTPMANGMADRTRPDNLGRGDGPGATVVAAPRAVDQLIEIGERAGLTSASDRATLGTLFAERTVPDANIGQILTAFELDRNGFMVVVSLLAADPEMVGGAVLGGAVALTDRELRHELEYLSKRDLLWLTESRTHSSDWQVGLTDMGREIAVFAIYRVLNAAVLLRRAKPRTVDTGRTLSGREFPNRPSED